MTRDGSVSWGISGRREYAPDTKRACAELNACVRRAKNNSAPVAASYARPGGNVTARGFAHAGGLLAYGVDFDEQLRKAAGYVDQIMNGESPSDLPVQAPTKYELVIKSAKALNLDIPQALLVTAEEVIE